MKNAQAITQWFNDELEKITTDGNIGPVTVLHNYSDKPVKISEQNNVLIIETTQDTPESKAAGIMNPNAKLSREIYLQGLTEIDAGLRPSDVLDAFVFEVRASLYPASKQLLTNAKIQTILETECRYILPEKGTKAAKFLMRFNITYLENYRR